MKKAKRKIIVECHRHVDLKGNKIGTSHPTEMRHIKHKTQAFHEWTIMNTSKTNQRVNNIIQV